MAEPISDWAAIRNLRLATTTESRPIWEDGVDIEAINRTEFEDILYRINLLKRPGPRQNVLLGGNPGTGKSHLLGRIRRHVLRVGDVYVAVNISRAASFWSELAVAYGTALERPSGNGATQRANLLDGLLARVGLGRPQIDAIVEGKVDEATLRALAPRWAALLGNDLAGMGRRNVAQALVLAQSDDFEHRELAGSIMNGLPLEGVDRAVHGLSRLDIDTRAVVVALDTLIGLSGRITVLGVDQLDGLIANARHVVDDVGHTELNIVANALMDAANDLTSTLVVVSCLIDTWALIENEAVSSVRDRFPIRVRPGNLPDATAGAELIAALLAAEMRHLAVVPPHPTWPFRPEAFATAGRYTARGLIQQVNDHLKRLGASSMPTEVASLDDLPDAPAPRPEAPTGGPAPERKGEDRRFAELDERFARYRAEARHALDVDNVDWIFPDLLGSALRAFAIENAALGRFEVDTILESDPAVHARIRYVIDADLVDEIHWSFRAILQDHYRSQQTRLQRANVASGLQARRGLTILRSAAFHTGKKTQEIVRDLAGRGAQFAPLDDDDVRTCEALTNLLRDAPAALNAWLQSRRPASATPLLSPILDHAELAARDRPAPAADEPPSAGPQAPTTDDRRDAPASPQPAPSPAAELLIGTSPRNGHVLRLPLEDLRVHAAIFAGSGSGKTVLLRRIVEEAALEGVSSIVLDPNNDLSRLGTPWPSAPSRWLAGDPERAASFFDTVETLVWTPRINGGRPLSFAPLAGLPDMRGDPDEFAIALDTAVALLAPRANLSATTSKGKTGRALLKMGLEYFVAGGGTKLRDFLDAFGDLPDHVRDLDPTGKLTREIATTLKAEMVNDPMFGDAGQAIEPGVLLQPSAGKRARISVINLVGLPGDELRQPFVSQLQMALFAWAKKNPAGDRPLNGLFVMDEAQTFAPAGSMTPSTRSTLALASQARKYGLGLLFATQAPKGIHNQITGNTGTQIFGRLVASNQVATVKELAAAKGGTVSDISKLRAGEFYIGSPSVRFQRLNSPMCMSFHPPQPPSEAEVVALARAS